MRRSRLRAGLLLVVLLALGGIGWQVWRRVTTVTPKALEQLGAELLPHVAQHIRNFKRVKMKDGRTVWEINAADAQYFESRSEIVVQSPEVVVYMDEGTRKARLTSKEGHLFIADGKELDSLRLDGDVQLFIDDLTLRADRATYDRGTDKIVVPGAVAITSDKLDVAANAMEVEVTPQLVRFTGDVKTVLRNDARTS